MESRQKARQRPTFSDQVCLDTIYCRLSANRIKAFSVRILREGFFAEYSAYDTHEQTVSFFVTILIITSKLMFQNSKGLTPHKCYYECEESFADPASRHKHMVRAHGYCPEIQHKNVPITADVLAT